MKIPLLTTLRTLRIVYVLCMAAFLAGYYESAAQTFTDPALTDPGYASQKLLKVTTGQGSGQTTTPKAANPIPLPTCFEPFSSSGADGWTAIPRNDDGYVGPISLGWNFSLYGTIYNSVFINNNGNVTFNSGVSQYTPDGFPITTPMIAAFWADVDTRNTTGGQVWYKVFPDRLVVTWDRVGYYSNNADKTNTFQLIIRANTASGFSGDDVIFAYGDMQWTTGSASSGVNGFGGQGATVGANRGSNNNFIQTGRFNADGALAPNAQTAGSPGGIDWLDGKCIGYQVRSSSGNLPPSVVGLPPGNSITVTEGQTRTVSLQFAAPETNQNVAITSGTGGLCSATTVISNNNTPNPILSFSVTGTTCNAGTTVVSFTATDNGTPAASQVFSFSVVVNAPVSVTSGPPIPPVIPDQFPTAGVSASLVVPSFTVVTPGQSLTYTATGLPPGCVFDPLTRIISGTPTVPGLYSIVVTGTTLPFGNLQGGQSASTVIVTLVLPTGGFANTNLFQGFLAGANTTSGYSSVGLGIMALYNSRTGTNNVAVGDSAGLRTLQSCNVMIGSKAGLSNITGLQNTLLGCRADVNRPGLVNAAAIGANARVSVSNAIVLGDSVAGTKVGIGLTAPQFPLDVKGTINIRGNGTLKFSQLSNPRYNQGSTDQFLTVNGQGEAVLARYRLHIASPDQWSDKVFAPGYTLRSLSAVDRFIKQNGHLPGIPSAAEVTQEGVDMTRLNAALLEKIEELTLYLIDMKKDNEAKARQLRGLEQENRRKTAQMKQQTKTLEQIKKRLSMP